MKELVPFLTETLVTPINVALVVATTWLLRGQVREIIEALRLREVEITTDGFKARFDIEGFTRKAYRKQGMGIPSEEDVREVVSLVESLRPFVSGRRLLWVDNHPENNRLELDEFLKLGVDVQTRRTTEAAMEELRDNQHVRFDLVISDWYRGGQPEGARLLEQMRAAQPRIGLPVVFYFSVSGAADFQQVRARALELGAIGATSSPRELLRWVFAELVHAFLLEDHQ